MKRPTFPVAPPVPWSASQAIGVVLGSHVSLILGGTIVLSVTGWAATNATDIPISIQALATSPFWIAGIVLSWLVVQRTNADLSTDFGLRFKPIDLPLGIVLGVATQVIVLPLLYWPIFQVLDKSSDDLGKAAEDLANTATGTAVGATVFLIMTCLCAPVAEEVIYRGVLLPGMRVFGRAVAIIGSSVIFAALHLQPLQFVGLAAIGLVCAVAREWSGRLSIAIIAHIAFNAVTAISLVVAN